MEYLYDTLKKIEQLTDDLSAEKIVVEEKTSEGYDTKGWVPWTHLTRDTCPYPVTIVDQRELHGADLDARINAVKELDHIFQGSKYYAARYEAARSLNLSEKTIHSYMLEWREKGFHVTEDEEKLSSQIVDLEYLAEHVPKKMRLESYTEDDLFGGERSCYKDHIKEMLRTFCSSLEKLRLAKIDQLKKDLYAEIVLEEGESHVVIEGGYEETRKFGSKGDSGNDRANVEYIWVDEYERTIVDKPRVTEPDTEKIAAAREKLRDLSKYASSRKVRRKARPILKDYELARINRLIPDLSAEIVVNEKEEGHYETRDVYGPHPLGSGSEGYGQEVVIGSEEVYVVDKPERRSKPDREKIDLAKKELKELSKDSLFYKVRREARKALK